MTLVELIRKFPDGKAAEAWIAEILTFHHVSPEHLDRYMAEFAGRHNRRPMDTEDMMAASVRGMVGKTLPYAELVVS